MIEQISDDGDFVVDSSRTSVPDVSPSETSAGWQKATTTTNRTLKVGDTLVLGDRWVRLVYVKTSGKIKLEVSCPDHVRVVSASENESNR